MSAEARVSKINVVTATIDRQTKAMMAADQDERQPPVVRDPRVPKFPVIYAAPTFEQVKSNISTNDLVQWAVLGSACFPLGYMVGTLRVEHLCAL